MSLTVIPEKRRKFYTCVWWNVKDDTTCGDEAYYAQSHLGYGYCKRHGEIIVNRYPKSQKKGAIAKLRKQGAEI